MSKLRLSIGLWLLLGLFALPPVSADEKYAPLPEKIVAAKTVYLQNDSGEPKFSDNVFRQLDKWGRWRVVQNRSEADIIVVLDHKDRFKNNFYLWIRDPDSGETLWMAKRDVAIGSWGGVAKALVSDLQHRLPPRP
jgi:hypothetical protein